MDNQTQTPRANSGEQQSENNISPTQSIGDKNAKLKWIGIGVLATIVASGVVMAPWFGFLKNGNNQQLNQVNNQTNQNLSPAQTPLSVDSTAWEMTLSKDEVKSSANLAEGNLIYAVKSEYTSTVYKRNLQSGVQTKIFEFTEDRKTDESGNFWNGLPPSIALSADRKFLAFADKEGLKAYDLQSKNTKVYIRKVGEGECENCAPKWSVDSMSGTTYALATPLWSSDDRYISFLQSLSEGLSFGVIDTLSGTYKALKNIYGSDFNWSSSGHSYVQASVGEYEDSGLYISKQDSIAETTNLAPKLGKTEDVLFLEANFSPDGRGVVFIFAEPRGTRHLAIANTDGTGFMVLAEKTNARRPFFSSDGNSVLYFQQKNDKQVLVRYDVSSKNSSDSIVLPTEFNRWSKAYWTKDGFLALVGILSSSSGLTLGGESTRMLILDVANKKVIYASPVFDWFTNFAGLSN